MTIKQKLSIVTVIFITTLVALSLTVFFGYRYVTTEASLANDFDNESMYLQMMLRGLNEVIINEGTPSSLRTENEGMKGFDKIHTRLMAEMKDPEIRRVLIEEINPLWKVIKEEIRPFQQHYVDLDDDEMMMKVGRLIIKTETIIEQVKELSKKKRALVDENSRLSTSIEKTMLIALVILFVCMAFLSRHIYHSISRPIEELNYIAAGFSRGELGIMMDESRKDEFGNLARRFNQSTKKLNHYTNELSAITSRLQSEITVRKEAEERISHMAYHDALTELPNRYLFQDRVNMYIAHVKRHKSRAAIIFLDIDNFKRVNDTLGHTAGDLLLKEVAGKIDNCIRKTDTVSHQNLFDPASSTVARLGGDVFIILLTEIGDSQNAVMVVQRIMTSLSQPIALDNNEVSITASIGVAVCPDDGVNADTLLKNADTAMYHAKKQGKNNFQFYKKSMNAVFHRRLTMENRLRKAIEQNELLLYYQPRIDMQTGTIASMEALIRWKDHDGGLVSPSEFIPLAEDTGLIIPIGGWVIKTACDQFMVWQRSGLAPDSISVNISGRQFQQEDFQTTVFKTLKESSFDPHFLELEITENILMQNAETTIETLNGLKSAGIRLSIDDFGTGYSSFSYLQRFPIDVIKIDISFIKNIPEKKDTAAIVTAIISMAHSLDLKVVAEGVESRQQIDFLSDNQCDEIQGYYYSRPLPAKELAEFLERSMRQPLEV